MKKLNEKEMENLRKTVNKLDAVKKMAEKEYYRSEIEGSDGRSWLSTLASVAVGAAAGWGGYQVGISPLLCFAGGTVGGVIGTVKLSHWYDEHKLKKIQSEYASAAYKLYSNMDDIQLVTFKMNEFTRCRRTRESNTVEIFNEKDNRSMKLHFKGYHIDTDTIHDPVKDLYSVALGKDVAKVTLLYRVDDRWETVDEFKLTKENEKRLERMISIFKNFDYEKASVLCEQNLKRINPIEKAPVRKVIDMSAPGKKKEMNNAMKM